MIGNHLLDYRLMREHQEQLLAEGQQRQQVKGARRQHRRSGRIGSRLSRRTRFLGLLFGRSAPAPLPARGIIRRRQHRKLPSLVSLERALINKLSDDACRRARRLAQRRAISRFARTHTLWYEALFDPRSLRALPDDFYKRNPSAVARSWAAQFPYFREVSRDRDVERLEPVAKDFLQILAEEEARLGVQVAC